jgi:sulfite reductase beta subunit-like hemoprotein
MIIGLVGKAQSGKDTVADYLVRTSLFEKAAFADDLKRLCKDMFDLTDAQVNTQEGKAAVDVRYGITPREILQKVGTDWFRAVYPSIWVNRLITKLQSRSADDFVITDIRFPNEVNAIKNIGGIIVKLVRLNGGGAGAFSSHASETALDSLPFTTFGHIIVAESGDLQKLYDGIADVVSYHQKG